MSKTCKHCLGMGKIIINAGTGLKATCAKCALPKPESATSATNTNTSHENELSKGQSHEEDSSR